MNASEAAALLAMMAAYDRRTIGESDALAWSQALHDINFADAQFVVNEHYRTSSDWLMPVHVVSAVRRLRRDRLERTLPMPDADPDDVQAWLAECRADIHAIADGQEITKRNELEERQQRVLYAIENTFRSVRDA